MGVIRGEIARRRGHLPIRWVGVMDDKARRVGLADECRTCGQGGFVRDFKGLGWVD